MCSPRRTGPRTATSRRPASTSPPSPRTSVCPGRARSSARSAHCTHVPRRSPPSRSPICTPTTPDGASCRTPAARCAGPLRRTSRHSPARHGRRLRRRHAQADGVGHRRYTERFRPEPDADTRSRSCARARADSSPYSYTCTDGILNLEATQSWRRRLSDRTQYGSRRHQGHSHGYLRRLYLERNCTMHSCCAVASDEGTRTCRLRIPKPVNEAQARMASGEIRRARA